MRAFALRIFLAGAALGVASARGAAATLPGDPCALVPDAVMTQAVGMPMTSKGAGGPSMALGVPEFQDMRPCIFRSVGRGTTPVTASVAGVRERSTSVARSRFRSLAGTDDSPARPHADRLFDIADDAVAEQPWLYARKGRAVYAFFIFDRASPPRNLLHLERLARAVMRRVEP